jgi:hypothetical protein
MPSSGTCCREALVRTDVSEERIASIIIVTRIGELGTTLAVTFLRSMLHLLVTTNAVPSSPIVNCDGGETSVLTRATRRNIPEDGLNARIIVQAT